MLFTAVLNFNLLDDSKSDRYVLIGKQANLFFLILRDDVTVSNFQTYYFDEARVRARTRSIHGHLRNYRLHESDAAMRLATTAAAH